MRDVSELKDHSLNIFELRTQFLTCLLSRPIESIDVMTCVAFFKKFWLHLALFCLVSVPSYGATLIHSYNFNDGTATDLVGGINGAFFGDAVVTNGSLELDGSGDYVEMSDKIIPGSGSYSVLLRVRLNSAPSSFVEFVSQGFSIDSGGGVPGGTPGFFIGHDPGGIIRVTDSWLNTGVSTPTIGVFHHYALVVDAVENSSKLFLDGTLAAISPFGAISTDTAGSNTRLGRQFADLTEYLNGAIDDVDVFSGVLTEGEVAAAAIPEPASVAVFTSLGFFLISAVRYRPS